MDVRMCREDEMLMLVLILLSVQTGTCYRWDLGTYWENGHLNPCPENCATCRRSTRTSCDTCEKGYYGNGCVSECLHACENKRCDKNNGWCTCIDGYYSSYNPSVSQYACVRCPVNCSTCTSSTICTRCEVGYYGSVCEEPCRNCRNNNCSIYGKCSDGCLDGYYSSSNGCDACPDNCAACIYSTYCSSCNVGYFGSKCDKTCLNCRNNTCFLWSGICSFGCTDGYYRATNECKACLGNCSICYSGSECIECGPGYYGNTCKQRCPRNCYTCEDATHCLECNNGFYGQSCETACSPLCNVCNKVNGDCVGCIDTYYMEGGQCKKCSEGCASCQDIDKCITCHGGYFPEQDTHNCDICGLNCSSCIDKDVCTFCNKGYVNVNGSCQPCQNCNDYTACLSQTVCHECVNGFRGLYCDTKCKDTCLRCDKSTGECTECTGDTFGPYCERKCSRNCMRLPDSSSVCWQQNGTCMYGCKQGSTGPKCTDESSPVTSPQVTMIVGSTAGLVAFIAIVAILVLLVRRSRVSHPDSKDTKGESMESRSPRAVLNLTYDDNDEDPKVVCGKQNNHFDVEEDSVDHDYAVLREESLRKPVQPHKTNGHDTDNIYDVTSGGQGPGMQADNKMSQAEGDTYSHISHASRARQQHHDDEGAYDHVTRHNLQKGGDDDTYDVSCGSHDYNYHVHGTFKQSADQYSTIRLVQ